MALRVRAKTVETKDLPPFAPLTPIQTTWWFGGHLHWDIRYLVASFILKISCSDLGSACGLPAVSSAFQYFQAVDEGF